MVKKPIHTLEQIESELIFDRDVTGETATARTQRETLDRASAALTRVAKAFKKLGEAADKKAAEFREEGERLKLDAELDEMERKNGEA